MYKKPTEIAKELQRDTTRVSISARILKDAHDELAKVAKKEGVSLSGFVAKILEDYSNWLQKKQ